MCSSDLQPPSVGGGVDEGGVASPRVSEAESTTRIVVEGANSAGDRSAVSHPAVCWSLPRQHADHDGMVVRV